MSSFVSWLPAVRLDSTLDRIGVWWATADAHDFGIMAVCVVVGAWFVMKYYTD